MLSRTIGFIILMAVACSGFASDTISADLGKIQVFTTEAGSRPGPLMKVFGSKVAVVDEVHPELARALEEEVAKQGYLCRQGNALN